MPSVQRAKLAKTVGALVVLWMLFLADLDAIGEWIALAWRKAEEGARAVYRTVEEAYDGKEEEKKSAAEQEAAPPSAASRGPVDGCVISPDPSTGECSEDQVQLENGCCALDVQEMPDLGDMLKSMAEDVLPGMLAVEAGETVLREGARFVKQRTATGVSARAGARAGTKAGTKAGAVGARVGARVPARIAKRVGAQMVARVASRVVSRAALHAMSGGVLFILTGPLMVFDVLSMAIDLADVNEYSKFVPHHFQTIGRNQAAYALQQMCAAEGIEYPPLLSAGSLYPEEFVEAFSNVSLVLMGKPGVVPEHLWESLDLEGLEEEEALDHLLDMMLETIEEYMYAHPVERDRVLLKEMRSLLPEKKQRFHLALYEHKSTAKGFGVGLSKSGCEVYNERYRKMWRGGNPEAPQMGAVYTKTYFVLNEQDPGSADRPNMRVRKLSAPASLAFPLGPLVASCENEVGKRNPMDYGITFQFNTLGCPYTREWCRSFGLDRSGEGCNLSNHQSALEFIFGKTITRGVSRRAEAAGDAFDRGDIGTGLKESAGVVGGVVEDLAVGGFAAADKAVGFRTDDGIGRLANSGNAGEAVKNTGKLLGDLAWDAFRVSNPLGWGIMGYQAITNLFGPGETRTQFDLYRAFSSQVEKMIEEARCILPSSFNMQDRNHWGRPHYFSCGPSADPVELNQALVEPRIKRGGRTLEIRSQFDVQTNRRGFQDFGCFRGSWVCDGQMGSLRHRDREPCDGTVRCKGTEEFDRHEPGGVCVLPGQPRHIPREARIPLGTGQKLSLEDCVRLGKERVRSGPIGSTLAVGYFTDREPDEKKRGTCFAYSPWATWEPKKQARMRERIDAFIQGGGDIGDNRMLFVHLDGTVCHPDPQKRSYIRERHEKYQEKKRSIQLEAFQELPAMQAVSERIQQVSANPVLSHLENVLPEIPKPQTAPEVKLFELQNNAVMKALKVQQNRMFEAIQQGQKTNAGGTLETR